MKQSASNSSAAAAGMQSNETVIESKLVEYFSLCAPDGKRLLLIDPRHSFDHSILVKLDCQRIRSHADGFLIILLLFFCSGLSEIVAAWPLSLV